MNIGDGPNINMQQKVNTEPRSCYIKTYMWFRILFKIPCQKNHNSLLGVDANLYIHTIKGKNLIKQGITDLPKKGHQSIFFKGKPTKIRRFIFPAEARMDKHRRRHFVVRMNKIYKKHGRRAFNRAYQIALYGYRDEFSPEYRKQKRLQVHSAILQEIQQAESRGKEPI